MSLFDILIAYVVMSVIIWFFYSLVIFGVKHEDDSLHIRDAFYIQSKIYENLKDELNIIGIIILESIITFIFAGANILFIFSFICIAIVETMWKLFCIIFKKK